MATNPATTPDAAPSVVAWPSRMRSVTQPGEHRRGRGDGGGDEGRRGDTVGAGGRSGVEPVPAEPQQAGAEHHERHVVRAEQRSGPTLALAEDDRQHQACRTGVDMDRGPAGEVDGVQFVGDPAAVLRGDTVEREHPVRDREVDDRRPETGEHQPGAELQPVGDRTRDQGDRDDREHQLECHEHVHRQRSGQRDISRRFTCGRGGGVAADETLQAEVFGRVTEEVVFVVAECDRVAVEHPQHRHHAHRADAHHEHVEHASGADHTAIEECQSRGH